MATIDYTLGSKQVSNMRILPAVITAAKSANLFDITLEGAPIADVPAFYHCQHGHTDHASRVFRAGDNVLCLHDGILAPASNSNLKIIGFPDDVRVCRALGFMAKPSYEYNYLAFSVDDGTWSVQNGSDEYGNIDWLGRNTAAEGEPSNATVLTWKGPACRHPIKPVDVFVEAPDYTHYDETIILNGLPADVYTAFSPYIYKDGGRLATAPAVSFPNDQGGGFGPLAQVLGAAMTYDTDGKEWLVTVVVINTRQSGSPSGFYYAAYARTGASDLLYEVQNNPGGWRKLGEVSAVSRPTTCFFFNQSGNAAACVLGRYIYRMVLDLDAMTAVFSVTEQPRLVRTKTRSATYFDEDTTPKNQPQGWTPCAAYSQPIPAALSAWEGTRDGGRNALDVAISESGTCIYGIEYKVDTEALLVLTHNLSYNSHYERAANQYYDVVPVLEDLPPVGLEIVSAWASASRDMTFRANGICNPVWTATLGTISAGHLSMVGDCAPWARNVTVTATGDGGLTAEMTVTIPAGGGRWVQQSVSYGVYTHRKDYYGAWCSSCCTCDTCSQGPAWPCGKPDYDVLGWTAVSGAVLDSYAQSNNRTTLYECVLGSCINNNQIDPAAGKACVGGARQSYVYYSLFTRKYVCY